VPATLHASLMARLDRLGLLAKEIAQVGAAIGRDFSYELLAAAAQRTEAELRDGLGRLVDSGLVFQRGAPPEATFLFKHALVQDTAYSMLLRGPRQALHARIARVLEERFPRWRRRIPKSWLTTALKAAYSKRRSRIGIELAGTRRREEPLSKRSPS
jgi:predicted ATPase